MQVLCTIKKSSQKINFLCASIGNELHNKIRQEKDFISFLALLGVIVSAAPTCPEKAELN